MGRRTCVSQWADYFGWVQITGMRRNILLKQDILKKEQTELTKLTAKMKSLTEQDDLMEEAECLDAALAWDALHMHNNALVELQKEASLASCPHLVFSCLGRHNLVFLDNPLMHPLRHAQRSIKQGTV